jgi:hypothetical protein
MFKLVIMFRLRLRSYYAKLVSTFVRRRHLSPKEKVSCLVRKAGHSGYSKNSGRVIRVAGNSDIKNCYPNFASKKHYLKFQVPDNSGSGSGFTRYTRN